MHVREGVKKHDIHIKPKSYKIEFLRELVVYHKQKGITREAKRNLSFFVVKNVMTFC